MFAISGTKLDIGYEERLILKDFDMTVRKGEITTFVGPNGSGKSTLLKTLTRLISPQRAASPAAARILMRFQTANLPRWWASCPSTISHRQALS